MAAAAVLPRTNHLRGLIANERKDCLALVAPIVVGLGHEVTAHKVDVEDVGVVAARERPDVALVGPGESSEHALDLMSAVKSSSAILGSVLRARRRLRRAAGHPVG